MKILQRNKELKVELDEMRDIYERRISGETGIWSSYTKCKKCGASWLWGIEDNLNFICSKCDQKNQCNKCRLLFSETDMHWDEITEKAYCHYCQDLREVGADARAEAIAEAIMEEQHSEPLSERDEYFLAH